MLVVVMLGGVANSFGVPRGTMAGSLHKTRKASQSQLLASARLSDSLIPSRRGAKPLQTRLSNKGDAEKHNALTCEQKRK